MLIEWMSELVGYPKEAGTTDVGAIDLTLEVLKEKVDYILKEQ